MFVFHQGGSQRLTAFLETLYYNVFFTCAHASYLLISATNKLFFFCEFFYLHSCTKSRAT